MKFQRKSRGRAMGAQWIASVDGGTMYFVSHVLASPKRKFSGGVPGYYKASVGTLGKRRCLGTAKTLARAKDICETHHESEANEELSSTYQFHEGRYDPGHSKRGSGNGTGRGQPCGQIGAG